MWRVTILCVAICAQLYQTITTRIRAIGPFFLGVVIAILSVAKSTLFATQLDYAVCPAFPRLRDGSLPAQVPRSPIDCAGQLRVELTNALT